MTCMLRRGLVPEAAAPQTTPQTNGGQVTGFVSWRRIFHIFCTIHFTDELSNTNIFQKLKFSIMVLLYYANKAINFKFWKGLAVVT